MENFTRSNGGNEEAEPRNTPNTRKGNGPRNTLNHAKREPIKTCSKSFSVLFAGKNCPCLAADG